MQKNIEEKFQLLGGIVPIGESFLPVTEEELGSLEMTLQNRLPHDYRGFLATYGASMFAEYIDFQPVQNLPKSISDTGKGHISSFYGGAQDPYQPLEKAIATYRDRMPDSVIPIADDCGNKICLGIKGKEQGKIYYWDHGNEWDEQDYVEEHGAPMPPELKFQNLFLIADSFQDFVQRLEPSDK